MTVVPRSTARVAVTCRAAVGRWRVVLRLRVGTAVYACEGAFTGGCIGERRPYQLSYDLPHGFFGRRSGWPAVVTDGDDGWLDMDVTPIDHAGGDPPRLHLALATIAREPMAFHSSAAFDAASSAKEESGDGVLSLSHTATGANRAVFGGVVNYGASSGVASTSLTYGPTPLAELWDQTTGSASNFGNAGYASTTFEPATGAQTVTSTLAGATDIHFLQVVTMTGVDQTGTRVGTPVVTGSFHTSPLTVTVGSAGPDDLVCDNLAAFGTGTPAVGADQTQRNAQVNAGGTIFMRGSTQLGSLGGVMSWTETGSIDGFLGAVAFKPVSGGGGARGLFMTPPMNGIGAGGSFFRDPLAAPMQMVRRDRIFVPAWLGEAA